MDRWKWSVMRAFAPALLAVVVAYVATLALAHGQADPVPGGAADRLWWVPYVALAAAVLMGIRVATRLWRSERSAGLLCDCGGLLGGARRDRAGRLLCTCKQCGRHWKC